MRTVGAAGLALALLMASAHSSRAEKIVLAPDANTRSVKVRFEGPHETLPSDLNSLIATRGRGSFHRIRSAAAVLPFIGEPAERPFDPLVLQEDVVRMRGYFRGRGLPHAQVRYTVRANAAHSEVEVTFWVREGRGLRLEHADVAPADSGNAETEQLLAELRSGAARHGRLRRGQRVGDAEIETARAEVAKWFADRGYLRADVTADARADSVEDLVELTLRIAPRERRRIGPIEIRGVSSVSPDIVSRALGVRTGDWISAKALVRGRENIQSIQLFRRATVLPMAPAGADSALPIRVDVQESTPRFTTAEVGYVTDGAGVSAQGGWTHPNFTGGARSLNVAGLVQTGWGTEAEVADRLARLTVTITQPNVVSPRMSLAVGPAFELRDDQIDRSKAYSALATLVYRINALQSAALNYNYTYRRLDDLPTLELAKDATVNYAGYAVASDGLLDSLRQPTRTSELLFSSSLGRLDDLSTPRLGLIVKPNLSTTWPNFMGNVDFNRVDIQATGFLPFPGKRNAIMLRIMGGRLWPTDETIPLAGEDAAIEWLRLRDYRFTAGGSSDVRGYATSLLGPKIPNIDANMVNGDTLLSSDRYVPIGGLARIASNIELRLGVPRLGRNVFAHTFLDMGRVWTPDVRFQLPAMPTDERRTFMTTGGGLGYYTPVGAIRFDVGYKLNPSTQDVRDPNDVLQILLAGGRVEDAPVISSRRYAYHFSLGLYF